MMGAKKTYILGMAKSALKVNEGDYDGIADKFTKISPGPARNLELDFLRLAYAAKELTSQGHKVKAYLMVTTPLVVKLVENWAVKYKVPKSIAEIKEAELTQEEVKRLVDEKTKNRTANTATSTNRKENAKANEGRDLIEKKLKEHIESQLKEGEIVSPVDEKPIGVDWDYCREMLLG